ncbi:SPASM domain-containing protein [Faecalibacterium prausnitzii]|uniref:SPASM domain-containing protein n=1 Tax=Faecalibacterium prausnitzii TaxID=853 RepID=A0A844DTM0_9FIRM|nr:SPASM domain-containing protein [Faecalibacterium prausnitzii]
MHKTIWIPQIFYDTIWTRNRHTVNFRVKLDRINTSPFKDTECCNCVVLPLCMGGCTYCRLNKNKFCIPEKYFLDKYINKLYTEALSHKGASRP